MKAAQVPIAERLARVPADARFIYTHSPTHSENIPVGALAEEALKEINRLSALAALASSTQPTNPNAKNCPGIPAPGCDYLATCNEFCTKCGNVHHSHKLNAAPQPSAVKTMDLDFARAMCRSAGIGLVSSRFIRRFAEFMYDWRNGDFDLSKYATQQMNLCFDEWKAFDPELATEPKQAKPSITLDFKQAAELLNMFGGEPSELTLQIGDGHSGKGLYVHHTSYPEEGAEYLGVTDEEAVPCVTGDVTNLLGYKVLERTIYRLEKRQENSGRPDEELNALKELFAALTPQQTGGCMTNPNEVTQPKPMQGLAAYLLSAASTYRQGHPSQLVLHQWAAEVAAAQSLSATSDAAGLDFLQSADLGDLMRFQETTSDGEGYDIGKPAINRLAKLGVVCSHGFGKYSMTAFGDYVIENTFLQNPTLPLKTDDDRDCEARAAIAAGGSQNG